MLRSTSFCAVLIWLAALLARAQQVSGDEVAPAATQVTDSQAVDAAQTHAAAQFFEKQVRPLLARHCYQCHSTKVDEPKGGLLLDNRAGLLAGGETGPAIVPGKPDESLLISAIRYESLEMPPKSKLSPEQVAVLVKWIEMGAAWPGGASAGGTPRKRGQITDEDRAYWAYQPIARPAVPPVQNTAVVASPIDAFVEAQLEAKGLAPNPPAGRRQLIRRAYFDLIGLPPTADEVEAFVRDDSPDAYARLIDTLLSRPEYGERWGRYWLDLVRYGETNGYERDGEKPFVWRYRDYVVKAFNDDKPYDRFVLEQLAGDELDDATIESLVATGYYRLGTWDDEPDDKVAAEYDELDDILSTTGQVFLGQTLGCARCHDHMFDPIPQRDYYEMLSLVRNVRPYQNPDGWAASTFVPLVGPREFADWLIPKQAEISKVEEQARQIKDDAVRKPLDEQIKQLKTSKTPWDQWTLGVRESGTQPAATNILVRGNHLTPGEAVAPSFLAVLGDEKPLSPSSPYGQSTGLRRALANWIATPANPLTARVMANRLWQYHFGVGIVKTPNDFGRAGLPPTHPELLNWLAAELIDGGWSLKRLHKTIMLSNTYRRSSQVLAGSGKALEIDPGNELLWRQNLRRLEAEAIRDTVLAVAGNLNPARGGRSMFPQFSGELLAGQSKPGLGWELSSAEERRRRSLYIFNKRGLRDPLLENFDYANTTSSLGVRPTTTVAPQALMLLNSRFMQDEAGVLADSLLTAVGDDRAAQVKQLYRRALGREPALNEQSIALAYLAEQEQKFARLANQIGFWPNVPKTLEIGYRNRLQPSDYLLGPSASWQYYRGLWVSGYEGTESVDAVCPPFALWSRVKFQDGKIAGRLRLERSSEFASLLVRAEGQARPAQGPPPRTELFDGYEVRLDPRQQSVSLIRRMDSPVTLATAPAKLVAGAWHTFSLAVEGSHVRLWLDGAELPLLEVSDERPPQSGLFGVTTFGGALMLDGVTIQTAGATFNLSDADLPGLAGWTQYEGDWQVEGGVAHVKPHHGGKALFDGLQVGDGEIEVEMKFGPQAAHIGGMVARVSDPKVGADNWHGYEISLDASSQSVFVGDHRNNWTRRQDHKLHIEPGEWYKLRAVLTGPRLQVYVGGQAEPLIDYTDPAPLPAGQFGLRTWGSDISYRNLRVTHGGQASAVAFARPSTGTSADSARREALQALCLVVLNLNELIYVD